MLWWQISSSSPLGVGNSSIIFLLPTTKGWKYDKESHHNCNLRPSTCFLDLFFDEMITLFWKVGKNWGSGLICFASEMSTFKSFFDPTQNSLMGKRNKRKWTIAYFWLHASFSKMSFETKMCRKCSQIRLKILQK